MRTALLLLLVLGGWGVSGAQVLEIKVTDDGAPLPYANVWLTELDRGAAADDEGIARISGVADGRYTVVVTFTGFHPYKKRINVNAEKRNFTVGMQPESELDEVVVTGTLKPVSRMETPVPVEVYSPAYFKKNPTANIFEALQIVNGVRPQINCNVCNTGDIHINGLEGPYTMVLIDGMPLVSGLSTVYGMTGIPNSLVERIEVVKGPASSLYGSQAVGGLINVITRDATLARTLSLDTYYTGWGEFNLDLGHKFRIGKTDVLTGVNYFNYDEPIDQNGDNFTDLTLQHRISVFQKWNFSRPSGKLFTLAGRFFYEDRWGGEMQWTPEFRGGDEIYGESIYTRRVEVFGKYELPFGRNLSADFSFTDHDQNSVYGDTEFLARQRIGFTQLLWSPRTEKHDLLFGAALRYDFYNDNTTATSGLLGDQPSEVVIPGVFVQDEIKMGEQFTWLLGMRYDYDKRHGNIFTPRTALKWALTDNDILRLNAGTGFRVVNLFTEDHAALTGAREVIIEESLKPEQSWNINLNYLKKIYADNGTYYNLELSGWYTRFSNLILPDYDTDPQEIRYANLDGFAVTTGLSANVDVVWPGGLKLTAGATLMDVYKEEDGIRDTPLLTESYSATWGLSYRIRAWDLGIDYTGNLYGPMKLPLAGDLDPRDPESPVWSIQNIQLTYDGLKQFELYGGVKNLLNYTPDQGNPFLIARADDPFDKGVDYDPQGNVLVTPDNPYALTFDPSYMFAPNQGIRAFFGVRYLLD